MSPWGQAAGSIRLRKTLLLFFTAALCGSGRSGRAFQVRGCRSPHDHAYRLMLRAALYQLVELSRTSTYLSRGIKGTMCAETHPERSSLLTDEQSQGIFLETRGRGLSWWPLEFTLPTSDAQLVIGLRGRAKEQNSNVVLAIGSKLEQQALAQLGTWTSTQLRYSSQPPKDWQPPAVNSAVVAQTASAVLTLGWLLGFAAEDDSHPIYIDQAGKALPTHQVQNTLQWLAAEMGTQGASKLGQSLGVETDLATHAWCMALDRFSSVVNTLGGAFGYD